MVYDVTTLSSYGKVDLLLLPVRRFESITSWNGVISCHQLLHSKFLFIYSYARVKSPLETE